MAKKQTKQTKEIKTEVKKLTPAQYWEWRVTMLDIQHAKLREKNVRLEAEIMNKEIENRKLKLALHREVLRSANAAVVNSQTEYRNTKERIENELDTSLDGMVIDEFTFEVRNPNEEKETKLD